MKRPPARCRKSLRAKPATSYAMAWRESSCDQRTSTRSPRRSNIYIDILKSSNAWATRRGDGSLKILRGIIFGRDCWTPTKSRCEKRRDQPVPAVYDRRWEQKECESAATIPQVVNILLLQLKRIGDLILTIPA